MLISKQWLEEFVKFSGKRPEEIARALTLSTVEVEGIIDESKALDHIVVGEIRAIEKHPNADKLKLCRVGVGNATLQIVCGGSNVREGMKDVVAKIGSH